MPSIQGMATAAGTREWFLRHEQINHPSHRREFGELLLPAVGWGSNSGELKNIVDLKIESALAEVLQGGCNLLDTSPAYRHRRSQAAIGKSLPRLLARGLADRENLFITSHCGFVALNRKEEDLSEFFTKKILKQSGLQEADFVAEAWSMHPDWITQQLDLATDLTGLQKFDCLFLDSPELGLRLEGRERWQALLLQAFSRLEELVAEGRISCWGIASLDGFFGGTSHEAPLQLKILSDLADQAAGGKSSLKMIQAPFSLAQLAFLNDSPGGSPSLQQQIMDAGLFFMSSLSLGQGQLCQELPGYIADILSGDTDAQRALQFVRSSPGLGSALVGMKTREHIYENLSLAASPCTPEDKWRTLFD